MRKTNGIDFKSFDRDKNEVRTFTNSYSKDVMAANKMLAKAFLANAMYSVATVITYPVRLAQDWNEFQEYKKKCAFEEQMRFDEMRRNFNI